MTPIMQLIIAIAKEARRQPRAVWRVDFEAAGDGVALVYWVKSNESESP